MTLISAANQLLIDLSAGGWRLTLASRPDAPLVEINTRGMIYQPAFAQVRLLPPQALPAELIEQVVLGWQKSDECWYLGLLLRPPIAELRGSRWCELARWPDPDQTIFMEQAQEAGERAALLLDVPFQFIQPAPPAPPVPPRPLPELPLALGAWELVAQGTFMGQALGTEQIALVRPPTWRGAVQRRLLMRLFWSGVYAAVSILTLTSSISLPNAGTLIPDPHILPYLGLAISVALLGYGFYERWRASAAVSVIVVDAEGLRGYNKDGLLWQVPAQDAQSVYVSEVYKNARKRSVEYGELNVHLGGGVFQRVIQQEGLVMKHTAQPPAQWQPPSAAQVVPLTRATYATDLQAVGLYLAERLSVPAWLDARSSNWFDQLLRLR